MPLAIGSRLGPYEIVAPLGAGAMGEVYKARDTRLDRFVAIKVLPAAVADDAQRRERFRREARAISTLTHPHICTLHDVGEHDGVDFLVATGRKTFAGTSNASIMAEILSATPPPLTDVEPTTPVALDRVVHKCLAKDPVRRWQHAADLHAELAWIESDLVRRNPRTTNALRDAAR
jgi:serine/threonine protein kinase